MADNLQGQNQNASFQLGYLFHYTQFDRKEPFQLDISIAKAPTHQHYDPEAVELTVVSPTSGELEHLTVEHPWHSRTKYQVCAGIIRLTDRKDKVEEAINFGANLLIESNSNVTTLTITSKAPILKITNTNKVNELLRDEYEILLAERRAFWLDTPGEFEKHLIDADPLTLYQAMLGALISKFENMNDRGPVEREALFHLRSQKHRLEKAGLIARQKQFNDVGLHVSTLPRLEDVI